MDGDWRKRLPDFGVDKIKHDGVTLSCRRCAPGLVFQDLHRAFETARKKAKPGDELSANPSKWPDVRGTTAIYETLMKSLIEGGYLRKRPRKEPGHAR